MRAEIGIGPSAACSERAREVRPASVRRQAIVTGIDLGCGGVILMQVGAFGPAAGRRLALTGRGAADQST